MRMLKNPRHELFAQALAKGKSADEAYQLAGYRPNRGNASELKSKENVRARVAELLARAARKAEVTIQSLAAELDEARDLALDISQPSAAIAASMGKAKLYGIGTENVNLTGKSLAELIQGPVQTPANTNDPLPANTKADAV